MTEAEIKKLAESVRLQMISHMLKRSRVLHGMLKNTADDITSVVIKATKDNKIEQNKLPLIGQSIAMLMGPLRPKLRSHIITNMRNAVDTGLSQGILTSEDKKSTQIGTSYVGVDGIVRRFNPAAERFKDSRWFTVQRDILDNNLVFDKTNTSVSDSVFDTIRQAERNLKSQIGTSVLVGGTIAAAKKIIDNIMIRPLKNIKAIISSDVIVKQAALSSPITPGYSTSLFTNLQTLDVVKSQTAYNAGISGYGKLKRFVTGYINRVHSDNPCPYCISINGRFFVKGTEPDPAFHIGCMCTYDLAYSETEVSPADDGQVKGYDFWTAKN